MPLTQSSLPVLVRRGSWPRAGAVSAALVALTVSTNAAAQGALSGPPGVESSAATARGPSARVALGGAPIMVGNADQQDGDFLGVVDVLRTGSAQGFRSALDEDDPLAVGDLTGDGVDEVVVADDDERRVDVHDTRPGDTFGDRLFSWDSIFDREEDALAVGDVTGEFPGNEVVVADANFASVRIYRPDGQVVTTLVGGTGFDTDDEMVVADVVGGPLEEIVIVNNEDDGRVDAFEVDRDLVATTHTGYDGNSEDVAAGDTMGDAHDEIVVANDEGGRVESHDLAGSDQSDIADTAFDSNDEFGVGPVNGTGTDEVVIANTEDSGRLDIIDFEGGITQRDSGYDADDRFAVGTAGEGDLDSDGIPDRVELDGIRDAEGTIVEHWDLPALGASPCRKDVLIDLDYMFRPADPATGTAQIDHQPHPTTVDPLTGNTILGPVDRVTQAFAKAPVAPVADCPYPGVSTEPGIGLHVDPIDASDQVPYQRVMSIPAGNGDQGDFAALKRTHFAPELDPYVHYNVWGDRYDYNNEGATTSGGLADFSDDGQDFVVTMGGFQPSFGTHVEQSVAFMHELGHSLGLDHGGLEGVNCKPNYLSIMNYSFNYGGLPDKDRARITVDYSRDTLDPLVEKRGIGADATGPLESAGVGAVPVDRPEGGQTVPLTRWYDASGARQQGAVDGPLNWNGTGGTTDQDPVDLNDDTTFQAGVGASSSCKSSSDSETLTGFDDWEHLDEVGLVRDDAAAQAPPVELTAEEHQQSQQFWDEQLTPDTSVLLDAPRPGFRAAVSGLAVDERHIYATHGYRTLAVPTTVDRPSTMVVLDRRTLAEKARIPVGFGARAVALNPRTHRAYVLSGNASGTPGSTLVTVVDTRTLTRLAAVEFPTAQATADIVVNPHTNRVYVSNTAAGLVHIIDGATNALLPQAVAIGPGPVGMAVDPTTDIVYVAQTRRAPGLPAVTALGAILDDGTARPRVLPRTDLGDALIQPVDVAVDPASRRLFVGGLGAAEKSPPSLNILDLDSRRLLTRLVVRGPVRGVAVDVDGRRVLAAGDRGVDVVDPQALTVVRRINAGVATSVAVPPNEGREFYAGDVVTGELHRRSYTSGAPAR